MDFLSLAAANLSTPMVLAFNLDRGRSDALLDDLYDRMAHHIGYVTTSDVSVIRHDKFP